MIIRMNPGHPHDLSLEDELQELLRVYDSGLEALKTVSGSDVHAQVRARKNLATRLALAQRLVRIYDEVKFVPDQRKPALTQLGCIVHGQEVHGVERTSLVRFDLRQTPYLLRFKEPPASQDGVVSYLELLEPSGNLFFSVLVELDVNESGRGWVPTEIEAFVPGDWVKDILALSISLDGESSRSQSTPRASDPEDLRKKFGLS